MKRRKWQIFRIMLTVSVRPFVVQPGRIHSTVGCIFTVNKSIPGTKPAATIGQI